MKLYRLKVNTLGLKIGEVKTSIIAVKVKDVIIREKNKAQSPLDLPPIELAIMKMTVILQSKTKEQNCPKKVIAFLRFLVLIVLGSRSRRKFAELSC